MSISQIEGSKKSETGWDIAIADAKRKIKELQFSIRVFKERRAQGEYWPAPAPQGESR
jgi:hypothetical protein